MYKYIYNIYSVNISHLICLGNMINNGQSNIKITLIYSILFTVFL